MLRWTSPRPRTPWRSQVELEVGDTVGSDKNKFFTNKLVRELKLKMRFPYILTDSIYNAELENTNYYHYAIDLLNEEAELEKPLYDELRASEASHNLVSAGPSTVTSKMEKLPRDLDTELDRRAMEMTLKKWLLPCWYVWINGFVFIVRKQISLTKIGLLGLMCTDKQSTYLVENALNYWHKVDSKRLNPSENRCIPIPNWLTEHIDLIGMIYTHMDRCINFLDSLKQTHTGSIESKPVNLQIRSGAICDNDAINSVILLLEIISEALESFYFLVPTRCKVDLASEIVQDCHPIIHDHIPLSIYSKAILIVLLNEAIAITKDEIMRKVEQFNKEGYMIPRVEPNTVNRYLSFLYANRFIERCSPNGTLSSDGRRYLLKPGQANYVRTIKLPKQNDPEL